MTWKKYELGDLIRVKHGWAFKGEHFSSEGTQIVLTPGNFYEVGGFKLRGDRDRYYCGNYPPEYLLKSGDLIVAMTEQGEGLLGSAALIPTESRFLHNQRLGLVSILDAEKMDKYYLYLLFNTQQMRQQISASASGTKVRHTSPDRIYRCKIALPSLAIQTKIARLLSAYDDLIEANLRRIKLLEEMAQITYEEWFVRLRFPGHETTSMNPETGLPEGHFKKQLQDMLILQRGFDLPSQHRISGKVPIYSSTGISGYHNQHKVSAPGVVTGRSGSLGNVMFANEDFWPLNTALWVKELKDVTPIFAYFVLNGLGLESYNSGVAVPTLNRNDVHLIEVIKPPVKLVERFTSNIKPAFDLIFLLNNQNTLLKEARDLLLPRLMTGMVDIDDYLARQTPLAGAA